MWFVQQVTKSKLASQQSQDLNQVPQTAAPPLEDRKDELPGPRNASLPAMSPQATSSAPADPASPVAHAFDTAASPEAASPSRGRLQQESSVAGSRRADIGASTGATQDVTSEPSTSNSKQADQAAASTSGVWTICGCEVAMCKGNLI